MIEELRQLLVAIATIYVCSRIVVSVLVDWFEEATSLLVGLVF